MSEVSDAIIAFADRHLQPYKICRRPTGDELIPTYCPFCKGGQNGDKGTFAISLDKGVFVCKRGSCGQVGRFEALAEALQDPVDLHRGAKQTQTPQEKQFVKPDVPLFPATDEIYAYFEQRKISKQTVDDFGIQSNLEGAIVFPFYQDGELIFVKYRHPRKPLPKERKEWRESGTKPILFGMDMCSFSKPLIITEGQIDAMSLYEAGLSNVVSVPSGCDDLSWVEYCWDWLERFKSITLFGDNDEPGRKMVRELTHRLDESRVRIVETYPDRPDGTPCKDANEILYFHGPFALIDMVESASEIPIRGVIDLADVLPDDPTEVPRIKTLFPELDRVTGGLREGSVTIFTGKAGAGKSTLTGQLLLNAIQQGYNVCAYSGELKKGNFAEWIMSQAAGSNYITLKNDRVRGGAYPVVPYEVQDRIREWYRGHFFLFDEDTVYPDETEEDAIFRIFTATARRYGCKCFLIDNVLTAIADQDEDENKAQAKFIVSLKRFVKRYSAIVLLVAHARKTKPGEKLQQDDISGNSAIIKLADIGLSVEPGHLSIIKNRGEGILKTIDFCYCPDSRRLYQADDKDRFQYGWDRNGIQPPGRRACDLPDWQVQHPLTAPF